MPREAQDECRPAEPAVEADEERGTMNIGKDFPKLDRRKRGRPRLLDPEYEREIMRGFVMQNQPATNRTVHNRYYHGHALATLKDAGAFSDPNLTWLLRPDDNGHMHIRLSISEQLGRTAHPVALRVFAEALCVHKPRAVDAVRLLRRWEDWYQTLAALAIIDHKKFTVERLARQAIKVSA